MRDSEREGVVETMEVGPMTPGAAPISILLTKGDLSGRSMLRPTRLQSGIL